MIRRRKRITITFTEEILREINSMISTSRIYARPKAKRRIDYIQKRISAAIAAHK